MARTGGRAPDGPAQGTRAPGSPRGELTSAGITDPALQAAYEHCRAVFARHGRTYFLATLLLPAARRPAVHALYAFARQADELVDAFDGTPPQERAAAVDALACALDAALRGAPATDPVLVALADTAGRHGIDHAHFTDFLTAMRMDTEVHAYATLDDLGRYMHGSAAVIGLQMLPVLGTVGPRAEAEPAAAALGVAFQLTNFLRDVGEDLDRGRVYLPTAELAAYGVDRELLLHCRRTGRTEPRVRAALAALAAHAHGVYRTAEPGIALLEPVSRECVRCAFTLYRRILDELAAAGYPLDRRVVVPRWRRAAVAGPGLARAVALRLRAR